jgi:hypothetical protein
MKPTSKSHSHMDKLRYALHKRRTLEELPDTSARNWVGEEGAITIIRNNKGSSCRLSVEKRENSITIHRTSERDAQRDSQVNRHVLDARGQV